MPLDFVPNEKWIRETYRVKGMSNVVLISRILKTCKGYSRLTVRQLFYILISKFASDYPATRAFYKRLDRYLVKIRRVNPKVHEKFMDPTRRFTLPPLPYPIIEVWVEKDSIKNFIDHLLVKFHLGCQTLRGFPSLTLFRKALARAQKRGVKMILYLGDFDPSGLLIEKVAATEMDHTRSITFHRIAITWAQIRRLKPPSRPVNLKDSRAKEYIQKYGDRAWEIEAIRPRTLFRLIEDGFRKVIPAEFLVEAAERERAAKLVRRVTEKLRREIEREALRLIREGVSEEEIRKIIAKKYGKLS